MRGRHLASGSEGRAIVPDKIRAALIGLVLVSHFSVLYSVVFRTPSVIWPFHYDTVYGMGRGEDFYAVYHAGDNVSRDIMPYRNNDDGVTPYFQAFRYLPIVAIAAQGLIGLSPLQAYLAWVLFLEGLLFTLVFTIHRRMTDRSLWPVVVSILLFNSPYFLEVHMGQFTFAATALFVLSVYLPWGVIAYLLAVVVKVFPVVALPAFVHDRSFWKYAFWAVAALMISAPYFIEHPLAWERFFDRNFVLVDGLGSGNYGFIQLLNLVITDLVPGLSLGNWISFVNILRLITIGSTAVMVVFAKKPNILLGSCTLLLAHFITYQHVWEHHISGILVISAALLTVPQRRKASSAFILGMMLILALPTPFGILDTAKNAALADPAVDWPRVYSYLIVLPKAIPMFALFIMCLVDLSRQGFDWKHLAKDRIGNQARNLR